MLAIPSCWSGGAARIQPVLPNARAGATAIELYDVDKDGFLSGKELDKAPGLKAALHQVDMNNDGRISADEIDARIQHWAATGSGRISVSCLISHNGKPLEGATVRFVPETFLGGDVKGAEGTTNRFGVAAMTTTASGARGVGPGFYRVEITKSGEPIPAKYNTETEFGQEIALDAAMTVGPQKFDLKY